MQFGLKNRLRLISLVPIIILFAMTSYYVYSSFVDYRAAQELKDRLNQNAYLNEVVGNIARERGMSAMYLGNKEGNILKSLDKQRRVVDDKVAKYLSHSKNDKILHTHNDSKLGAVCQTCENSKTVESLYQKITIKK